MHLDQLWISPTLPAPTLELRRRWKAYTTILTKGAALALHVDEAADSAPSRSGGHLRWPPPLDHPLAVGPVAAMARDGGSEEGWRRYMGSPTPPPPPPPPHTFICYTYNISLACPMDKQNTRARSNIAGSRTTTALSATHAHSAAQTPTPPAFLAGSDRSVRRRATPLPCCSAVWIGRRAFIRRGSLARDGDAGQPSGPRKN
jgi:hypothetical protein